jgi:hypothetical protein
VVQVFTRQHSVLSEALGRNREPTPPWDPELLYIYCRYGPGTQPVLGMSCVLAVMTNDHASHSPLSYLRHREGPVPYSFYVVCQASGQCCFDHPLTASPPCRSSRRHAQSPVPVLRELFDFFLRAFLVLQAQGIVLSLVLPCAISHWHSERRPWVLCEGATWIWAAIQTPAHAPSS